MCMVVVHTSNTNNQEAKAWEMKIWDQLGWHSKFQVCLGYKPKPCLKILKNTKNINDSTVNPTNLFGTTD